MTTLLLRLAAPMQAWSTSSKFARRTTDAHPSKSGVLGLLAAAQGRRRTDPIEDLLDLRFGVRLDQPGQLQRDFQTARSLDGRTTMPLTYRFYLADAAFVAAVEGEDDLVRGLDEALRAPTYPLYLGRRSCPPVGRVSLGSRDGALEEALDAEPWHASTWWQKKTRSRVARLEIVRDALPGESAHESYDDVPLSFDPEHRRYAVRRVVRDHTEVANPHGVRPADDAASAHDPMSLFGGS